MGYARRRLVGYLVVVAAAGVLSALSPLGGELLERASQLLGGG
jgi:hypothetical protein